MICGYLDSFIPPYRLAGWAFCDYRAHLRVRAICGSIVLGEACVDRIRPDLPHLGNNGEVGWLMQVTHSLSLAELANSQVKLVVIDDANQVIGFLSIWQNLLDKIPHRLATAKPTDSLIEDFKACEKTALLILGMHRSGTSALTRIINLLGPTLPAHLLEANFANETGYWESAEVTAIHDEILLLHDSSWDDILPLDVDSLQPIVLDYYKTELTAYLVKEFAAADTFVIKDPRLCKFVPLWLDVLARLNISVKIVIPFRHPVEVAQSLQHRDGFLPGKSFLLWLHYVFDAERHTRRIPRCFVNYAQLLSEHEQVIAQMAEQLMLSWPNDSEAVRAEIAAFINPSQYHQRMASEELKSMRVPDWAAAAYAVLNLLTQGHCRTQDIKNSTGLPRRSTKPTDFTAQFLPTKSELSNTRSITISINLWKSGNRLYCCNNWRKTSPCFPRGK